LKNKKGFTLIELLAVIVILGLLLAIAIPSISKYIIEVRKKTLVSSIGNYISSIAIDVNDQNYKFSEPNTIYAVPIECIALEKGGSNPLGEWLQSNDNYWAYVLVQYDDIASSYKYGFTFKDSNGYGMYPIVHDKIDSTGSQIKKELNLNVVKDGYISRLTSVEKWDGFVVNEDTRLTVLESREIDDNDDGVNTCIIRQKGSNHGQVLQEKEKKYEVGNEVCFGSECFDVIKSDSTTVTLFAQDKIVPSLTNPKQDANAPGSIFSNSNYWNKSGVPHEIYGDSYPAYVYDENSAIYPYLEAYKKYLKEEFGIYSIEMRLISLEEVKNDLQCTNSNCKESPYLKVFQKDYVWWLGTTGSHCHIIHNRTYHDDLYWGGGTSLFNSKNGIRPVLVVSKWAI